MDEHFLATAAVRRLMKSRGAYIVSEKAVESLKTHLEDNAANLTKKALKIANDDGREKVSSDDLIKAIGGLEELYDIED